MEPVIGRFAPTPSGRMHLGNVFAALLAWLSVRSQGGEMVLRMEDLDTARAKPEYAEILRSDLVWLGLDWDRETAPQSRRTHAYDRYFERLREQGLLYPCYCTRAQLHSLDAPHLSDGTYIYPGTCRDLQNPPDRSPSWRIRVPNRVVTFTDGLQGRVSQNLETECGDFVLRRSDGLYVYQLAVVVDDGEAGVTEVVRGLDLLGSVPRQMYLQEKLGFATPSYVHVPLLLAPDGRRLSKRDKDLDLGYLRRYTTAPAILGQLACAAGLLEAPQPISARELVTEFDWKKVGTASLVLPKWL